MATKRTHRESAFLRGILQAAEQKRKHPVHIRKAQSAKRKQTYDALWAARESLADTILWLESMAPNRSRDRRLKKCKAVWVKVVNAIFEGSDVPTS